MKEGQEEIYYIVGTSLFEALRSPYLEAFRKKDYEVLILLDDIDDFIFSGFEYKGKKMKSITKGDMTLNKEEKEEKEKAQKKYEKFIDLVKDILKDDVKDVRLSGRLTDTVCCLVTDEGDLDPADGETLEVNGTGTAADEKGIGDQSGTSALCLHEYVSLKKTKRAPPWRNMSGSSMIRPLCLKAQNQRTPALFRNSLQS